MDLVTFLNARLDEDEAVARAAMEYTDRDWDANVEPDTRYGWRAFLNGDRDPIGELNVFSGDPRPIVAHIVRWDPARVLADITAKRQIIAAYVADRDATVYTELVSTVRRDRMEYVVRVLASGYVDHPDFQAAWKTNA